MTRAHANGIDIEYDEHGDPSAPPMILIMGLGAQMTAWPDGLLEELARRGYRVIRFDNRDIGLSTWFDEAGVPDAAAVLETGVLPPPAYTMSDMAADTVGLMDALGIPGAHIVGASMGGMIAQTLAIEYPERTWSLASIFSTTGEPSVGQPKPEVVEAMFMAPPVTGREEAIEADLRSLKLIAGTGYPADTEDLRRRVAEAYDRAYHPAGMLRQGLTVLTQPDRTEALGRLRCPTLVVHGDADALVDVSGGEATAAAVAGSELWIVPGMGHELPSAIFGELSERIAANARRGAGAGRRRGGAGRDA